MEGGDGTKRKLNQDKSGTQPTSTSASDSQNASIECTEAAGTRPTQPVKRLKRESFGGTTSPGQLTNASCASTSLESAAEELEFVTHSQAGDAVSGVQRENQVSAASDDRAERPRSTSSPAAGGVARVAYASGDTTDNPVYLVTNQSVADVLLANRLGIDHIHDFPYPEAIAAANAAAEKKTDKKKKRRKNKQISKPPPPPLLLRREEVYVAVKEGLLDYVFVAGRRVAGHEFVEVVDKCDTVLYLHHVFTHFWKKGLVISPATKFGGHFLLYMTDRDTEHVRRMDVMSQLCFAFAFNNAAK